jgi:hypothetical protein
VLRLSPARGWCLFKGPKENNNGNGGELGLLNANVDLDFKNSLSIAPYIDPEVDPVLSSNINSLFYDVDSFIDKFTNVKAPIVLSIKYTEP